MNIGSVFTIPTQHAAKTSPTVQFGRTSQPNRQHLQGDDRVMFGANAASQINIPLESPAVLAQQLRNMIAQDATAVEVQAFINTIPREQRAHVLTQMNQNGHTALHLAVGTDNAQVVQALINAVPEHQRINVINQGDNLGETALHWTVIFHNQNQLGIAQVLVNAVPAHQRNNIINQGNHPGASPLDLAQAAGNQAMVNVLLNPGETP